MLFTFLSDALSINLSNIFGLLSEPITFETCGEKRNAKEPVPHPISNIVESLFTIPSDNNADTMSSEIAEYWESLYVVADSFHILCISS